MLTLPAKIEQRLREEAALRSLTPEQFVERLLATFLASGPDQDDTDSWRMATQNRLSQVWPVEDFDDWHPPQDR